MSDILQRFDAINVWKQGDQRAPHKPLLILYALGRWQRGETGKIAFRDAEPVLTTMLKEFGPPRKSYHPEYPFWWLQTDGIWVVHADAKMKPRASNSNPPKSELLAHNASGEFTDEVKATLTSDPALVGKIAASIMTEHFPESYHEELLDAAGLTLETGVRQDRKRDPKFRTRVLKAYEYRCAVCGFDVRLGSVSIALDAAHIKWHQAGGPDTEVNGLALCVLHHKVFDLGAFTVDDGVLLVSDQANGTSGFLESLMGYHGKPIRPPQNPGWKPEPQHLEWHGREVFKGDARHRG